MKHYAICLTILFFVVLGITVSEPAGVVSVATQESHLRARVPRVEESRVGFPPKWTTEPARVSRPLDSRTRRANRVNNRPVTIYVNTR